MYNQLLQIPDLNTKHNDTGSQNTKLLADKRFYQISEVS